MPNAGPSQYLSTAGRLAAGAATVAGLAVCHTTPLGEGMVFFLLPAVCGALAWFTRGTGATVGGGFGIIVGLSLSIALTQHSDSPLPNQFAFAALAASIGGLIGCLSGDQKPKRAAQTSSERQGFDARPPRQASTPAADALRASEPPSPASLTGLVSDFEAWLDEAAAEQLSGADLWARFGQFIRSTLRAHTDCRRVRVFRVIADGNAARGGNASRPTSGVRLEPLIQRRRRSREGAEGAASDRVEESPLGQLSPELTARLCLEGLSLTSRGEPVSDWSSAAQPEFAIRHSRFSPDSWLLPIRAEGRVVALVESLRSSGRHAWRPCDSVDSAGVAAVLSLFWRQVAAMDALASGRRLDGASGVLNRAELLSEADRIVEHSIRNGEPLMMMGVAVEGLRAMDDGGRYGARDALIRRLGEVMCEQVRSDDMVGRFADDRFIVLLRRLDARLGTLIAEKLVRTLKQEIGRTLGAAGGTRTRATGGDAQSEHEAKASAAQVSAGTTESVGTSSQGVRGDGTHFDAALACSSRSDGRAVGDRTAEWPVGDWSFKSGSGSGRGSLSPVTVRAALVAGDMDHSDGASLLARTLSRLDRARESGVELAAPNVAMQPGANGNHACERPAAAVAAARRPSVAAPGHPSRARKEAVAQEERRLTQPLPHGRGSDGTPGAATAGVAAETGGKL